MGKKLQVGTKRLYTKAWPDRNDVILWEVLPIENNQLIKVTFISKNSPFRQGIRLAIDVGKGELEINGIVNKGMLLWEDTAPKETICKCRTDSGLLSVYNIWQEDHSCESQRHGSGMLLEEKGNLLIYHCNDYGLETNFDKLVFSIEKL